jgi:hypothetical protein
VRGVDALVAEDAADLEDPVDAADDEPLEVELERDAQRHVEVERVEVGRERPGRRAAVHRLQDRRLDLDEAVAVQHVAHGPHDGGAVVHHPAAVGVDDEVDVALPDPQLGVGEAVVLVRQRRSALLVSSQLLASTLSSPRRLLMTSPVTPTWSPRSTSDFHAARRSSPTPSRLTMTCSCASPSWIVAKQSLPPVRLSITRPVTLTTSPLEVSVSRPA